MKMRSRLASNLTESRLVRRVFQVILEAGRDGRK